MSNLNPKTALSLGRQMISPAALLLWDVAHVLPRRATRSHTKAEGSSAVPHSISSMHDNFLLMRLDFK